MRDLFFTVTLLAAVPLGLISNYLAVAYWYWISLFQPHSQSYGFATSVPFGPVAAGVALLSWMLSSEKKMPPATPIVVLLVMFAAWTTITTFTAMFPQAAQIVWDTFIKTVLMVFVGMAVIQTRQRLEILIWAICLAVGYYGFKLGLFALAGGGGGSYRGPTYMNQNNGLARAMIMFIPLLYYLYLQQKQLWVRIGIAGVGLSSTVALVFSGSRGAWVAALAMAGFVGLRIKGGLLWMTLAGLAALAVIPFVPEHIIKRFLSIGDMETDASFQGRLGAWRYSLDLFERHPVLGGGFRVFDYDYGKASHNSFVQALGEQGIIGLVLFLSLLWVCISAMRWIRRQTESRADLQWANDLAFVLQVIFVGYLVGSLTINHAVFPLLYCIIGVLASLHIIVRRELQTVSDGALQASEGAIKTGRLVSARDAHLAR